MALFTQIPGATAWDQASPLECVLTLNDGDHSVSVMVGEYYACYTCDSGAKCYSFNQLRNPQTLVERQLVAYLVHTALVGDYTFPNTFGVSAIEECGSDILLRSQYNAG